MSWFSKAFKSVTKEIKRTAKKVSREVGRVGSQIGTVLSTLPIPGIGGLAGSSLDALGAVLQGKSAAKYFEKIPQSTLNSLVRGTQILLNPSSAVESLINTIGVGAEQFAGLRGAGVGIREALNMAQSGAGIVSGAMSTPLASQGMSLLGNVSGLDLGGVINGTSRFAGIGNQLLSGGGSPGAASAALGGSLLGGPAYSPAGYRQPVSAPGSGFWGYVAKPSGFPPGYNAIVSSGGNLIPAPAGSSTRVILYHGQLWR